MAGDLTPRFVVRAPIAGRKVAIAKFPTREAAEAHLADFIVRLGVPYVEVHEELGDRDGAKA